jgi:prephenate dehydrogenase
LKDQFKKDFSIVISWRNKEKWERVAKNLGVSFTNDNIEAVKNADIVIVSVTIWNTANVIRQIWPYLKENAVLADVTSIKKVPYDEMIKFSDKVLVIPTHPMFWPYVKSIVWQVVILTPPEKTKKDKRYIWFKKFLKNQWAKIFEISPQMHDKIMSIIQWLTHFSLFVIAETLVKILKEDGFWYKNDENLYFLDNFVSPVYKLLISLVGRYMSQNPWLYAEIQINNEENKKVQEKFIETTIEFNKFLFKDKKVEQFVDILEKWKDFFWNYASVWQKYTDKIIFLLANQIDLFRKNVGNRIKIQNIYTKQVKEGLLERFDNYRFVLDWKEYDINEWVII